MNKKHFILSTVLIAVVLMSFLGGTTFAKYLTEHTTSASLQVAKWSVTQNFLVNGVSTTSKSINLAKTYSPQTLTNGKIAPGSYGKFVVKIDGTGTETGIIYKIQFDNITGQKPKNLEFLYDNQSYSDLSTLSRALTGTIAANAKNKILNLEVDWRWMYNSLHDDQMAAKDTQDTLDRSNNF